MKKKSTFIFDVQTTKLMDDMKEMLHVSSRSDVIRRSLQISSVLLKADQNGADIYIREPGADLSKVILM